MPRSLFAADQMSKINEIAKKSKKVAEPPKTTSRNISTEIEQASQKVKEYFKDSPAILLTTPEDLHNYIDKCIEAGYAGIDTETTGLDKVNDTIVGSSLYYPGGVEAYIPNKHLIPIFDEPRKNQLTYEQCHIEFQRLVDAKCKMIFANADYDIAMLYKDYKVDFIPVCYYDVILAWRVIKEDEPDKRLKVLYAKYVKGLDPKNLPKSFSDFFTPQNFPYSSPDVAKLYAANDAKITYDLFKWQLPYVTKTDPKCQEKHFEKIADIVWGIEMPMIKACAEMHRTGVYLDTNTAISLSNRYGSKLDKLNVELSNMVQDVIDENDIPNNANRPFRTGKEFNPNSSIHMKYLCYKLLGLPPISGAKTKGDSTLGKGALEEYNTPITNKILDIRKVIKLSTAFVQKLPEEVGRDGRVHGTFNSIGADTGRMSSKDPNMQQIPSHVTDIRHLFRATPEYEEVKNLEDNQIKLHNYQFLYREDGSEVEVRHIKVGDKLQLMNDTKQTEIKSVSDVKKIGYADIVLTFDI